MKRAMSVSRAGPLYRAGSAQALFLHKVLLLCLYERPRPRARLLESRFRQAGQPTSSCKPKVHKQVCLKIKIRREIEVELAKG